MKAALFALVLVVAGALACPALAAESPVARFAIVIGNDAPERRDGVTLRYADDDAVATHRLLRQAGVESLLLATLDSDSRRFYPGLQPDGAPSERDLDRAFDALTQRMRRAAEGGFATELYFFYSGHGDVDAGEGYVVLEGGRLTRSKLYGLLSRSPATRNHVFVDACKSYFLVYDKGPGGTREPFAGGLAQSAPGTLDNTGFVLSTSSDRDSHEWARYQAGILSHELRSALRGAADVDGDGRVTYAELGAFLATANEGISNPGFRPDFLVRPPARDLHQEVLSWSSPVGAVRLEGPALGHVYIETPSGERLLDAHPDGRRPVTLHLPEERPLFVRRNDGSAEHMISTRDPVTVATLDGASDYRPKGAVERAFASLFDAPFGLDNVIEYLLQPPPPPEVPPPERRSFKAAIALPAATIAIATAAGGTATGLAAIERSAVGPGTSQAEVARRNVTVRQLDVATAVLFGVAAVAGATWGWTRLWPDVSVSVETVIARGREPGATLTVGMTF
jgi:hypothetical protein